MKRIKISMLAVMAALAGFASCEKPETTPPEPAKVMEIDAEASYEIISTTPKDVTFNINSNTPWQITSDAEWCTVSPMSSDESSLVEEITVSFTDNEDMDGRTAKVTVTGEGIKAPTIITFNQAKKSSLEVQQISTKFAMEGGEQEFTITANESWTVESNAEWLTFDKTNGTGTGTVETVKAICAANESAIRKAVVTINAGSLQKTFEVEQDGYYVRFIETDATARTFQQKIVETKSFEFETNAPELEVLTNDPDATAVIEGNKVNVTLGLSGVFNLRTVKITLVPKGKNVEDYENNILEVTQPSYWVGFTKNGIPNGTMTLDQTSGTATLVSAVAGEHARIVGADWNRLGRYEIEFEKIEVGEDFLIDFISDNRPPLVSWELALGKNAGSGLQNGLELNSGGKSKNGDSKKHFVKGEIYPAVEGWNQTCNFEFSVEEVRILKKVIIEMKENAADQSKIDILVQADDKTLIEKTVTNPYLHKGSNKEKKTYTYNYGGKLYIGFPGTYYDNETVMHGTGTIVLKSAKFIPLN